MLVIERKVGERIAIGANVTVTVTEIRGQKVRLGIQAPLRDYIARLGPDGETNVEPAPIDQGGSDRE